VTEPVKTKNPSEGRRFLAPQIGGGFGTPQFSAALVRSSAQRCGSWVKHAYLLLYFRQPSECQFVHDRQVRREFPADYMPWRTVNSGRPIHIDARGDQIAASILQDGYSLLGATEHARGSEG
jgi:hypothetical protein